MRVIGLAVVLTLNLTLAPLGAAADAQEHKTERSYRVGILASTRTPHLPEAFRQGLSDLGGIEGQNITLDYYTLSVEAPPTTRN